jgi:hypothetical protein
MKSTSLKNFVTFSESSPLLDCFLQFHLPVFKETPGLGKDEREVIKEKEVSVRPRGLNTQGHVLSGSTKNPELPKSNLHV